MEKIERIKGLLKERLEGPEKVSGLERQENALEELKRDVLLSKLYSYTSNLRIGKDKDLYYGLNVSPLEGKLAKKIRGHQLLTVTPVQKKIARTEKREKLYDLYFSDISHTIFLDLDRKELAIGSSDSSGKRGTYDKLAIEFEEGKAPTLMPIFVGKELLKVYFFRRFIGNSYYFNQWSSFPKRLEEKGYHGTFSYVHNSLFDLNNITLFLEPERKRINLLKLK